MKRVKGTPYAGRFNQSIKVCFIEKHPTISLAVTDSPKQLGLILLSTQEQLFIAYRRIPI
ncbi:MAG: hypothetical protein ACJ72S_10840 [Nitrososphaeraceae archaeon]